jgi:hypothetical protein
VLEDVTALVDAKRNCKYVHCNLQTGRGGCINESRNTSSTLS